MSPPPMGTWRALGPLEEVFWQLDAVAPLNFAMAARVHGPVTQEGLGAAFADVLRRHPLLRARIAVHDGRPHFLEHPVALDVPLVDGDEARVRHELSVLCSERFDTERGPLVRALGVRHGEGETTLVVGFHHTIGDGRSGVFVVRDWLHALAAQAAGRAGELEAFEPTAYVGDRFPRAMRGLGGAVRAFATLFRQARAQARVGRPRTVPLRRVEPGTWRSVGTLTAFDRATTQALLAASRSEGTTLHGAVFSALAQATAEVIEPGPVPLLLGSAIDLRRRVEPPFAESSGLFISAVNTPLRVAAHADPWALARDIKRTLEENLARGDQFLGMPASYRVLAWLGRLLRRDREPAWRALVQGAHPPSLALTNLGSFTIPDAGPFHLEWVGFQAALSVLSPLGAMACTVNDRLALTVSGSVPAVEASCIERVRDGTHARLAGLVGR